MAESGDSMKEQQPREVATSSSRREILQKGWTAVKKRFSHPAKNSLEGEHYPNDRQLSRREFLKEETAAAAATAVLVGGGLLAAKKGYDDSPAGKAEYDRYPKPEGVPKDILTKEELQKAGITVYQTPEVQLYLRQGVFDLPLFKDAKENRIKGVVISLVDSDSLNWNSTSKLPMDARAVWQGLHLHPSEYPEEYWQKLKGWHQRRHDHYQAYKEIFEKELQEILSGAKEEYLKSRIDATKHLDRLRDIGEWVRSGVDQDIYELERLERGLLEKDIRQNLELSEREVEKDKKELEILQDRTVAIEHFEERGSQGQHIDLRRFKDIQEGKLDRNSPSDKMRAAIRSNPQWQDKVYLYICVGKEYRPHPKDSYPRPDWYDSISPEIIGDSYSVSRKDEEGEDTDVGFIARHEVFHYNDSLEEWPHTESQADHSALDSITQAWEKYSQTGDTSGYSFVFVSDEGVTITKNMRQQPTKAI